MAQVEMYRTAELPHEEIRERFASCIARGVKTEEDGLQEIKERSKGLGLKGQVTLVDHKIEKARKDLTSEHSLQPSLYYPLISKDEMKLWEIWLPEIHEFESYGEKPDHYFIPESVLDEYEVLKKLGLFEKYNVRACHHGKGYELLLIGVEKGGACFRIARWGERLIGEGRISFLVGKVLRGGKIWDTLFGNTDGFIPIVLCISVCLSLVVCPFSLLGFFVQFAGLGFFFAVSSFAGIVFFCSLGYLIIFFLVFSYYHDYLSPKNFLERYR